MVNVICNILLCFFIFKAGWLTSILAVLVSLTVFALFSIPLHNVYVTVTKLSTEYLMNIPIYKLSFSFITYLLVFILYRIFKRFNINIYLINDIRKKSNSLLIISFVLGIISVYVQTLISSLYTEIIPTYLSLLSVGILLFYFILSLYGLFRTNVLEITKRDLAQTQQYNKTLTIMHDNIRAFKHDFNNIITTLGGYIQTDDLAGLKRYYSELLVDCSKTNNLSSLSPSVINEPAIYSLLTNKYYFADEKGITINLDVFIDLSMLNMKTYEFSRILRNITR